MAWDVGQRSLRSETPMSRINVARLGGWRAVSINLMVASEIFGAAGQRHATEAGGVALVAQQASELAPLRG